MYIVFVLFKFTTVLNNPLESQFNVLCVDKLHRHLRHFNIFVPMCIQFWLTALTVPMTSLHMTTFMEID